MPFRTFGDRPPPMPQASFYPLRVAERHVETATCISIALAVPEHLRERFAYTAGEGGRLDHNSPTPAGHRRRSVSATVRHHDRFHAFAPEGGQGVRQARRFVPRGDHRDGRRHVPVPKGAKKSMR